MKKNNEISLKKKKKLKKYKKKLKQINFNVRSSNT